MLPLHESCSLTDGDQIELDRTAIRSRVDALSSDLKAAARQRSADFARPLALAGDNHPDWILADLAAALANVALVPVPGFFTDGQIAHVCSQAGIQHVVHEGQCLTVRGVWPALALDESGKPAAPVALPAGTQKITFTSGTTGQPKGICLTWEQQMLTARSLVERLQALDVKVHLNLLPLAVLLENIAGVLAPLMMGAKVVAAPLHSVGLRGSSDFDPVQCLQAIARHKAESIILLPQMLHALVGALKAVPDLRGSVRTLKFVAVGGAPTPAAVLDAARAFGMPVYEGYGLTECASVVCLNGPDADCPGTVGIPLPGLDVGLTPEGEVWVEGRSHAGVLGQTEAHDATADTRILTGDIGQWVEREGQRYLQIVGRRKNVVITSFGRNVSPEWPERLLMDSGLFRQAVVMGDGQPNLRAVLVPAGSPDTQQMAAAVERANQQLPDYARIAQWHVSPEPFTPDNGLSTPNGRPLRGHIEANFADAFTV